ncbi:DUF262 domain-containing protein [Acidovorax sp. LjRoot66]|uniref:DUF262 domain-containing protein n=1 Tax=Acidovorax sp. LjRoot66 TaxID=3342334 RepID=UPI003ECD1E0F
MEDNTLENFADDADDELEAVSTSESDRFRDAVLYGTDWTIRTLLQQIEEGNIELSPDFQRRDAWSLPNKSRFIESVALQLPIPQIVLAERKQQRGTYVVLDGKQRLLTLAQFAGQFPQDHPFWEESARRSHLKLTGLKVLSHLNGKTYQDIQNTIDLSQLKTQFDNHTIRSALIRNWPDEDYLYEVFIRLNTGSAKLSPQELRQAMKPGQFTSFLGNRSADSKTIQKLLGIRGPDFRMRDVDLLLRMVAFATRLPMYKGNLKPFLDDTQSALNRDWNEKGPAVIDLVSKIENGFSLLFDAFGGAENVGRRWVDGKFEYQVNRAILDVQVASILDEGFSDLVKKDGIDVKSLFIEVCNTDQEFVQSISGTTKSIVAIKNRYRIWKTKIETATGLEITFPRMPNG